MYLLGYDVGSSSVKASLVEIATGKTVASATAPKEEMEIIAMNPGWAEQHPRTWWQNAVQVTREIGGTAGARLREVKAIGIAYQMHGLVAVDGRGEVLRPSIIWCDSRAVDLGNQAFADIGSERCLRHMLNSPGNFTASKLKWVMQNEPDIYSRIEKIMLPGDYIASKMTGEIRTTPSGLSEGILWDFKEDGPADLILDHYGIPAGLLPRVVPTFSDQGRLKEAAARELGLEPGIVVAYRGGDQPNNALSLNVLEPGEMAATAGTSGVVYGVGERPNFDPLSRFNTFIHVNHRHDAPRYGNLLCLNGTGILYSWLRHNFMSGRSDGLSYAEMDELANSVPPGCGGLTILPYGNGAERTLENRNLGAAMIGLEFNIHTRAHVLRAAHEGIVFALNYGLEIMRDAGIPIRTVRAGSANMFKSVLFAEAFATLADATVELFDTDGSQGAARGAGIGAGIFEPARAFAGLQKTGTVEPNAGLRTAYQEAYGLWRERLTAQLGSSKD